MLCHCRTISKQKATSYVYFECFTLCAVRTAHAMSLIGGKYVLETSPSVPVNQFRSDFICVG